MIEIKTALRGYHRKQSVGLFPFLIPSPQKVLYFFFGCRADGRSALTVRFAAIWATFGQRFRLKAVMADIAEIVVHCVLHFLVMWKFICHQDIFQSQGSPRYW